MKSTRFLVVGLVAATTLGLVGCQSTSSPEGGSSEGADTSLSDVQDAGVITVGTEGTYRPFTFHEDGTGDLTGYDVEIVTAVAEKLGVEPEFEETQWDAIFAGLDAGRFDIIANQVSINDEREAKYELSEPYTVSPGVVIVVLSERTMSAPGETVYGSLREYFCSRSSLIETWLAITSKRLLSRPAKIAAHSVS